MRAPLYALRVASIGVVLLSLGSVLVLKMFRATLGPVYFAGDEATSKHTWRVALWSPGSGGERDRSRRRWDERLRGRFEIEVWRHFPASPLGAPDDLVVILDGVPIDSGQAQALRSFVEDGGHVAVFGALEGERGGGPEALSVLLGRPVEAAQDFRFTLLPAANGPLSAGFSVTERIPLRRVAAAYSLALPARSGEVRWLNADRAAPHQGAAWRDTPGSGRLVWWSVRPDEALDRVDAQAAMTRVVRASVAWLLEEPFAEVIPGAARDAFEGVETLVTHRAGGRFLLSLTNRGADDCPPVALRLYLNRAASEVEVSRTTVQIGTDALQTVSEVGFVDVESGGADPQGERVVAFRGPALAQGESRSFYVDMK